MAKGPRTLWVCRGCGAQSPKWLGRCPECAAWATLEEEAVPARGAALATARPAGVGPVALDKVSALDSPRTPTGIGELDRVLGGGLVPGAAILVGGDPGIGKSTLLLQAAGAVARAGRPVLYVTGEESPAQVKMRAERLGVREPSLHVLAETSLASVLHHAGEMCPTLCVVDSVQTLHSDDQPGAPGTVSQVRECGAQLTALAKSRGIPVVLIGHVTKEGTLAGPRTLEHLVDVVLSFEGDRFQALRILRATKNRFGATDELGVFEMAPEGLREVPNPSAIFCGDSTGPRAPGAVAVATLQGSRPLLVEIQALASAAAYPASPVRRTAGADPNRVHLVLAALAEHADMSCAGKDVFVNVAGGLSVEEPAADLGIAVAVASSLRKRRVPADWVAVGEVGLGGEVRPVPHLEARLREAARLGLKRAIVPGGGAAMRDGRDGHGLSVRPVRSLAEALEALA